MGLWFLFYHYGRDNTALSEVIIAPSQDATVAVEKSNGEWRYLLSPTGLC